MSFTSTFRSSTRVPALQLGKTAAATIASWLVAGLIFPNTLPVFAAIAALLVVQPSVNQSFSKAIERSVGVIAGVVVGTVIGIIFGERSWIVLVAIVAAIFVGWVVKLTPGSAVQVPISAMLVLSVGSVTPDYAVDRIVETLIGAALGVVINAVIVPPVVVRPAERDVGLLARELAAGLDGIAEVLSAPAPRTRVEELLIEARLLRPMLQSAEASIKIGDDSLRLNPRRSAHRTRLEATKRLIARLNPIVTRVVGMTRAVHDHYDGALSREPTIGLIAVELRRAAHDLRLVAHGELRAAEFSTDFSTSAAADDSGSRTPSEPSTLTTELPALTAPLVISTPHPEHWILIGSLLEDLRRVREEIVGD